MRTIALEMRQLFLLYGRSLKLPVELVFRLNTEGNKSVQDWAAGMLKTYAIDRTPRGQQQKIGRIMT